MRKAYENQADRQTPCAISQNKRDILDQAVTSTCLSLPLRCASKIDLLASKKQKGTRTARTTWLIKDSGKTAAHAFVQTKANYITCGQTPNCWWCGRAKRRPTSKHVTKSSSSVLRT